MTQRIAIKRMITIDDLEDVLRNYADLQVIEKHRWGCRISYVPEPAAHIVFIAGEIQATSSSVKLAQRLEKLASDIGGELIQQEEDGNTKSLDLENQASILSMFWPVVSAVLLILLIWRW